MEMLIVVIVIGSLFFVGTKVHSVAEGITIRHSVPFFGPAFYFGMSAGGFAIFGLVAVGLAIDGQSDWLNPLVFFAICGGLGYWGWKTNLETIPDRDDAVKLTVIQFSCGALLAIAFVIWQMVKTHLRR